MVRQTQSRGPTDKGRAVLLPHCKPIFASDTKTKRPSGKTFARVCKRADMKSFLEIYSLASQTTYLVLQTDGVIEAPNWDPSGQTLLVNGGGKLYRVPLDAPQMMTVDTGFAEKLNNDHGISPDGRQIVISNHRDRGSEIFLLPATGGEPRLISPDAPSWWHGWSPDGQTLAYVAARGGRRVIDVYTIDVKAGPETRLTQGEGHCDGPDYSADGSQIYYNCDRDGHAQIWVMGADDLMDRHQTLIGENPRQQRHCLDEGVGARPGPGNT